jgi:hypothetical protein
MAVACVRISSEGSSDLLADGGMVTFALDGQRELGEVSAADDATELALGFEHAGGGPARAHHSAPAPSLNNLDT